MTSFRDEFELKISRKLNTSRPKDLYVYVAYRGQDRRKETDRAWFSEQDNIKCVKWKGAEYAQLGRPKHFVEGTVKGLGARIQILYN